MTWLARYLRDRSGAAAVEFALFAIVLAVPMLSVVDVAVYIYDRMQVDMAAQAAVQTLWANCSSSAQAPVATNCATGVSRATAAGQSTSLNTAVTIATSPDYPDNYYCVSGTSYSAGTAGTPCYTGGPTPGYYVIRTATYTYTPLFRYISVASLLPPSITRVARARLF